MSKVLDEINEKYAGKLVAEKVDVNQHPEVAREHNVRYVPTLLFIDAEGKVLRQEVGYRSLDQVLSIFKEAGVTIE
ncbi:MAG: thioredoxin family protein [Fretibacterium sp.]|uniref:thioredoxin family protein n=1 Tax=Fretibacterium sp. OH1220_COT-178 TaxID=2491047 RepID=UPI000F5FE7F5|nr:thioredoxin family protein [Fretibacterium sp. OH1220_COT-178]MDO4787325.1 thioredoxin family protein [Fretibacterium sp.]RRD64448.1 thioredoxin [Fretibacterium sp. OH1220_COT-178]